MLKNVKLSGKLWGLTGLLLLAVLTVTGSSIWSTDGMLNANQGFSYAAELDTFFTEKKVDHLNWVNKVKDLFVNNLETLKVTLDPTQCGLGKFLYGENGNRLVERHPEMAGSVAGELY